MSTATEPGRITVDLLSAADIDELNEFYNRLHGTHRDRSQFAWEFLEAPAGPAVYAVARDARSGRIIGSQCVIPIDLIAGDGRRVRSGKSEDTLVDPAYRGQGVFERMYERLFEACRQQGITCIWGFTAATKPFNRMGFTIPFQHGQSLLVKRVHDAFRYLDSRATGNSLGRRMAIYGLCLWSKAWSFWRSLGQPSLPGAYSLDVRDKVEPMGSNALLKTVLGQAGAQFFSIERSSDFMAWRFTKNPYSVRFRQVHCRKGDELQAELIFSIGEGGAGYLVQDLYAPSMPAGIRSSVLKSALREIRKEHGIPLIRTWDFVHNHINREEIGVRRGAGMIHLDRGISFVWRSLEPVSTIRPEDILLSRMACEGTV